MEKVIRMLLCPTLLCLGIPAARADAPAEPVASARKYIPYKELLRGHPKPDTPVYHNEKHSLHTRTVTQQFAKARGLSPAEAEFLGQVALLHDWDSSRTPGTAARVPATIKALRQDFAGKKPLFARHRGTSVLKDRFGWGKRELNKAIALIQRTEFPFGNSHPNPHYRKKSPVRRYAEMLARLPAQDRAFVLREGPILSEYGDKTSWYVAQDFKASSKAVEGLVNEINQGAGFKVVTVPGLKTTKFLQAIGQPNAFEQDYRLANKFGVKGFKVPRLNEFFAKMPARYKANFLATRAAFGTMERQAKANKPYGAALLKAEKTAQRSLSSQQRARARARAQKEPKRVLTRPQRRAAKARPLRAASPRGQGF